MVEYQQEYDDYPEERATSQLSFMPELKKEGKK